MMLYACILSARLSTLYNYPTQELLTVRQYRGIVEPEDLATLEATAEEVLGPPNLQTPDKSILVGNYYRGSTAYERSLHAVGVKGTRCYTNANTVQSATNITSTTKHSKYDREMDENLGLRQKINHVSYPPLGYSVATTDSPPSHSDVSDNCGQVPRENCAP